MTKFINCTPHAIMVYEFGRSMVETFEPSGVVPRVAVTPGELQEVGDFALRRNTKGEVTGLPERVEGTFLIVSGMVLEPALAAGRTDCVAPDTGPTAERNEKGHIVAVRGFV